MREIFTSGSVGGAPGNRCFYLEHRLGKAVLLSSLGLHHPVNPTVLRPKTEELIFPSVRYYPLE